MAVVKHYNIQRRLANEQNANVDRGLDTEARFGTLREFQRTVDTLLMADSFVSYRTRMDLLISQYLLLRSEDRRRAELCDLVAVDSLNEAGFQKHVKMLVLRLRQGKVSIPSGFHPPCFFCFELGFLILRPTKMDTYNMPAHSAIKQWIYVQLGRLLFIYFCDLISRWNLGRPLIIASNGTKRSFSLL